MIKRMLAAFLAIAAAVIFFRFVLYTSPLQELPPLAAGYADRAAAETGAANIVTSIVVTYRGLDTLGEVTVLFLAASGIGLFLSRKKHSGGSGSLRPSSEFVRTGVRLITPVIMMFGVYIFLHGHLTPGGGFQGGAVIATAVLLNFLADPARKLNHGLLNILESGAGFFYVLAGLAGLVFAGGFLDSRVLPSGHYGTLLSAGLIPLIYTFIGLKVGTELAGILENLKGGRV